MLAADSKYEPGFSVLLTSGEKAARGWDINSFISRMTTRLEKLRHGKNTAEEPRNRNSSKTNSRS